MESYWSRATIHLVYLFIYLVYHRYLKGTGWRRIGIGLTKEHIMDP